MRLVPQSLGQSRPRRGPAAVVAAVLALFGCGLPPESVERIAECTALYGACVETAKTMAEYRRCRSDVDAVCLGDGGAP